MMIENLAIKHHQMYKMHNNCFWLKQCNTTLHWVKTRKQECDKRAATFYFTIFNTDIIQRLMITCNPTVRMNIKRDHSCKPAKHNKLFIRFRMFQRLDLKFFYVNFFY